jgi:3-oxoacyl-[acyl-carrier protein] reductase
MDLRLTGRRAIVCAASKGLGRACAEALAAEGVSLAINARTETTLRETAATIARAHGVSVVPVAGDIAEEATRRALLAACPDPDILVTNAGGPPPGNFRDWDRDDWIRALDTNMLTPILLIKAVIDGMIARQFGRILNITSGAVKAPIAALGLSNGARAGLTGFVAGLAREVARHGVTVNNLLPGPFETDRLLGTMAGAARQQNVTLEEISRQRRNANPSQRFGRPEEFGAVCAFLASGHAGYMTGQNILIDGGAYPGTL